MASDTIDQVTAPAMNDPSVPHRLKIEIARGMVRLREHVTEAVSRAAAEGKPFDPPPGFFTEILADLHAERRQHYQG